MTIIPEEGKDVDTVDHNAIESGEYEYKHPADSRDEINHIKLCVCVRLMLIMGVVYFRSLK